MTVRYVVRVAPACRRNSSDASNPELQRTFDFIGVKRVRVPDEEHRPVPVVVYITGLG